jgi:hypothetical protein
VFPRRRVGVCESREAQVDFHDPFVVQLPTCAGMPAFMEGAASPGRRRRLAARCRLIVTDHDGIDYAALGQALPLAETPAKEQARAAPIL